MSYLECVTVKNTFDSVIGEDVTLLNSKFESGYIFIKWNRLLNEPIGRPGLKGGSGKPLPAFVVR